MQAPKPYMIEIEEEKSQELYDESMPSMTLRSARNPMTVNLRDLGNTVKR
jgi:hypothetical protein